MQFVPVLRLHSPSSCAAPLPAGVDALFLQSWMGLDAEAAAKVAADGAAALAARRELLNSARSRGEQVGARDGQGAVHMAPKDALKGQSSEP